MRMYDTSLAGQGLASLYQPENRYASLPGREMLLLGETWTCESKTDLDGGPFT